MYVIKILFHVNNNRRCDDSRLKCDKVTFLSWKERMS